MKDIKDYDLLLQYKDCKTDKDKNMYYNEFYRRYENFLKIESNKIYKSVGKKLKYEYEDCFIDSMECLKLTIDWINLSKFNGDTSKFNLSYYIKLQVSAKINSYLYTTDKKQKREITYKLYKDFENSKIKFEDCIYYKDNFEEKTSYRDFHKKFNNNLSEKEIKIKRFLMEGIKDYKIKNLLSITNTEYEKLKNNIKENILTYGLYSVNISM